MSLEVIKRLRELTGAAMGDVKSALDEAGGDETKAIEILRKRGQKIAAKKADRATNEGLIGHYVHTNGKVGVLVSVVCETDFVARNEDFKKFVHDIALQVAATRPKYLDASQVPAEVIDKEKEIYRQQLADEKKPAEIIEKIIEGKLQKFFSEVCLLDQPLAQDDSMTVRQYLEKAIGTIGENIKIKDFVYMGL